jgi:hypothetical protein
MKIIITERQNNSLKRLLKEERKLSNSLRRRIEMLDYEVESRLGKGFYAPDTICHQYNDEEDLLENIIGGSIDSMYFNYFSNMGEDWPNIYDDMVKYVNSKYGDEIRNYYVDNCLKKRK